MSDAGRGGLFLVLEGVEGSGKTTQRALLTEWLERRGLPVTATREPGGTATGEAIRRILLESPHVAERAELLLFLAARAAVVDEVVRPALAEGRIVVADRFDLSTLAYQGHGRGIDLEAVRSANRLATGGLAPDLTIVLDVPAETGLARTAARPGGRDRIEGEGQAFLSRVATAYRLLARQEVGVICIDGTRTADLVHTEIVSELTARFPETFANSAG
jgi:dTMP kinase